MFEHVVAALFRAHGYRVQTNTVLVGRSGARHEIDVLAVRSEDLLETRVGVECKNWAQPIDTAVVARARLVREDLGLGHMIIACPGGATPAARTTAAEAGLAIWERRELDARLGAATLAALTPAPPVAQRRGVARAVTQLRAERTLRSEVRGPLGMARGQLRWLGDAWMTMLEVRFGCAERAGVRRRLRVRPAYTVYESLTGGPCWSSTRPAAVAPDLRDPAPTLPGAVGADALRNELTHMLERAALLVQPSAVERHQEACRALMIPDAAYVSIDEVVAVEWPICLAIVDDRRGSRVVVLDAVGGRIDPQLGERWTAQLAALAEHLGAPADEPAPAR
jgi:hypothetical protein